MRNNKRKLCNFKMEEAKQRRLQLKAMASGWW